MDRFYCCLYYGCFFCLERSFVEQAKRVCCARMAVLVGRAEEKMQVAPETVKKGQEGGRKAGQADL